jgi:hypothetical protein
MDVELDLLRRWAMRRQQWVEGERQTRVIRMIMIVNWQVHLLRRVKSSETFRMPVRVLSQID